jgi:hypothetical protein
MPDDALNSEIDALRARLQAELETQLTTIQTKLDERHQAELAEARRVTAAEAREHWSARLDALRAEWASRLRAEVAGASAESARTRLPRSRASGREELCDQRDGSGGARSPHTDGSRAALHRLAGTLRTLSEASSLTATLDALADGAAAEAADTALFVVSNVADVGRATNGLATASERLERWRSVSFDDDETDPVTPADGRCPCRANAAADGHNETDP